MPTKTGMPVGPMTRTKQPKAPKRTIRQNRFDNWYGYEGGKKVCSFGDGPFATAEECARDWLMETQPLKFYKIQTHNACNCYLQEKTFQHAFFKWVGAFNKDAKRRGEPLLSLDFDTYTDNFACDGYKAARILVNGMPIYAFEIPVIE